MTNNPNVYVAATGMTTPVGGNTAMATAAVWANISRAAKYETHNRDYNPISMAIVPDDILPPVHEKLLHIDTLNARSRRLIQLCEPALNEAVANYPDTQSLPLFLAAPQTYPGCPSAITGQFFDAALTQMGVKLNHSLSRMVNTGRAGGLHVLDLAFRYFEETGSDHALIGGVDSYRDPILLEKLDKDNRLMAINIMDSFVPGEGAGFLLLATKQGLDRLNQTPLCQLFRPGQSIELGHLYSDEPYKGEGLEKAFKMALQQGTGNTIETIFSSMNGEHFWAKEYGVAITRNHGAMVEELRIEHPCDCFGDLGAALAPVMIGLAIDGYQKKYIKGSTLVYCSSDTEHRTAVCLQQ